jgi:hypothetical protein
VRADGDPSTALGMTVGKARDQLLCMES